MITHDHTLKISWSAITIMIGDHFADHHYGYIELKNLYFYVPIFWKPPKIHDFATNFLISQKNIFDMRKN